MLERDNRALASKLSATGVGSREALVGLGTDDVRMAEVCEKLSVLPDGKLHGDGCTSAHSFFDQMRITPW